MAIVRLLIRMWNCASEPGLCCLLGLRNRALCTGDWSQCIFTDCTFHRSAQTMHCNNYFLRRSISHAARFVFVLGKLADRAPHSRNSRRDHSQKDEGGNHPLILCFEPTQHIEPATLAPAGCHGPTTLGPALESPGHVLLQPIHVPGVETGAVRLLHMNGCTGEPELPALLGGGITSVRRGHQGNGKWDKHKGQGNGKSTNPCSHKAARQSHFLLCLWSSFLPGGCSFCFPV